MRFRALSLLLVLAAFCFPQAAKAGEPDAMAQFQVDKYPPPQTRLKLVLVGAAVTGVSYGAAVGASYLFEADTGSEKLRIPIVGPWMKIANTSMCRDNDAQCHDALKITGAILAGVDGLLQAGGIGIMLQSLFVRTKPRVGAASYVRNNQQKPFLARYLSYQKDDLTIFAAPVSSQFVDVGFGFYGQF